MFSFMELVASLTPLLTAVGVIVLSPIVKEFIPSAVLNHVSSLYEKCLSMLSTPQLDLIIESSCSKDYSYNEIYEAASNYLPTVLRGSTLPKSLNVSKSIKREEITLDIVPGEPIIDSYEGIKTLKWRLVEEKEKEGGVCKIYFVLSFDKKFREVVLKSYLSHVLSRSKAIQKAEKMIKLYSRHLDDEGCGGSWHGVVLEHPATFKKLAMDPKQKKRLIRDLNRFADRKEFYQRVGKAWKRGYLIHGPPGTGKSTLIAAMANHLKFDIYDLNLSAIRSDSDLRTILLSTSNRSIMVIEDVDCGPVLGNREQGGDFETQTNGPKPLFSLSGFLNFMDGLGSSCGDERIIVFTTNHKDRLDRLDLALLRPGRIDVHVHMPYCTMDGFKLLASTYLEIKDDHELYGQIEGLLRNVKVTPAEIAEELLRDDNPDDVFGADDNPDDVGGAVNPDDVLGGVVKFLEEKTPQNVRSV